MQIEKSDNRNKVFGFMSILLAVMLGVGAISWALVSMLVFSDQLWVPLIPGLVQLLAATGFGVGGFLYLRESPKAKAAILIAAGTEMLAIGAALIAMITIAMNSM